MTEMVDQALGEYEERLQAAGLSVVRTLPDHPVWVWADGRRLWRVLDNLLSNAVKYSPDGGQVLLRARRTDTQTCIEVADSGIGMTEAEQGEVFTKFFRSGTARKAAIPGVGLGLVISRKIVEEHGGTITLRSEAGKGTVFTATLPRTAG